MHVHLVQVRLSSPFNMEDEALDTWRAFLNAHAHVTRRIGRDLAEAGLPDLGWYDLLWTLYRAPARAAPPRAGSASPRPRCPAAPPARGARGWCGARPTRRTGARCRWRSPT